MSISILFGCVIGLVVWFLTRYLAGGLYTVDQNERAVKTIFGRADRIPGQTTLKDVYKRQTDCRASGDQPSPVLQLAQGA